MITENIERNIVRSNDFKEKKFDVEVNGTLFRILTDLYVSKQQAIIRELACNSRDSHILNSNEQIPIEVTLPSVFEPTFSVRDFGPGLSEDDIWNVYCFYNRSLKRSCENSIGFFGLGAKSPFTYTPSFQVVSRFEGRKYIYNAFRSENNEPKMALLMEEECWEPSGIEVIIPVKPADIQSFADNAQYVFQYWDLKPTIKGRADFTFKETKWHLYSEKSWGFPVFDYDSDKKSKVVMGGVQYLLDGRNISDLKTIHRKILDKGIILFARMGEIHVPPPRESVEYTEKTINFVKTRLNEIENEIKKTVETKMASVSSEYEARKLYLDLFRQEGELNIVQDIIKDAIKIKFKDVEILTPEFESPFFISSLHFYEDRQYNTRVKLTQWHHKINLIGWEKIQSERGFPSIFYNLGEKGAGKLRNLARHYLKQHNLPTEKKIWVIQPNSLDELKNFCSEKGIDFGLLHNIDEAIILPPKPAKQKVCVEKPSEFYNSWVYDPEDCIEEKDEEFNVLNTHLEYANVDFQKDSGYYIVREGKYIPHYGSFSQISSVLKELDPDFKDNPVIYVVTARYEKKMGLGWKQLAPNVKSLIEAKWAEFKVQKIHYSNLSHQLPCYGTCELDKMKGFYEKGKLKNDVLKEFFSIVALDDASRLPYSNWTNSFNLQTPNLDDQKRVLIEKASELWKKLIDSAPLIRHIPYHNWNQPEVLAYLKEKTE